MYTTMDAIRSAIVAITDVFSTQELTSITVAGVATSWCSGLVAAAVVGTRSVP